MVRSMITYYVMLMPERRYEIQQHIRVREAAHAACIAAGLPQEGGKEEEMAPMEVEEAEEVEEPDQQVSAFNMEQAEFAVAQSDEMAEQQAILESIQNEAYVEANRTFLRLEQAETGALFAELDAEIEAEEAREEESELQLPPMLAEPGTEIVVISDEE